MSSLASCELMRRVAGVDLPETRRHLVSGRLSRRLRATGLASYGAYYQLVCGGSPPDEYHALTRGAAWRLGHARGGVISPVAPPDAPGGPGLATRRGA